MKSSMALSYLSGDNSRILGNAAAIINFKFISSQHQLLLIRCTKKNLRRKERTSIFNASSSSSSTISASSAPYNRSDKSEIFEENSFPDPPETSGFTNVFPYLLKLAVTDKGLIPRFILSILLMFISKASGLMAPFYLKEMVEHFVGKSFKASIIAVALFGLCRIISSFTKELLYPLFSPIAQSAARKVAARTFSHILDLDIQFHLNRKAGELAKILDRGHRSVNMLYRTVLFTFMPTVMELVFICAYIGKTFTPLVSGVIVISFILYISFTLYSTEVMRNERKNMNKYENLHSGKAVDALQNFETVALFNNQDLEVSEYVKHFSSYQSSYIKMEGLLAIQNTGQLSITALGLSGVLAVMIMQGVSGGVSAGDLILAQGLLMQLWLPLSFFGWFFRETREALLDMEEYLKLLKTKPMIEDGHLTLPSRRGNIIKGNGNGSVAHKTSENGIDIEFKDVCFGYSDGRQVLRDINLKIPSGKSFALVGPSGSGKSTLCKLLARLVDVNAGDVIFDGINVKDLKTKSLRDSVGVVPQDTILFNETILKNIAYGNPDASVDDVIKAAKLAQLHDSIMRMPSGYDTVVGQRGLRLSGGEKQRVAIARLFIRNPRLLICDEATSALDTATEREIVSSLTSLAEGRTSVFVAHRLSTIKDCDQILVFSGGVIVEQGTHEELLKLERTYYDMWNSQIASNVLNKKNVGFLDHAWEL